MDLLKELERVPGSKEVLRFLSLFKIKADNNKPTNIPTTKELRIW